MNDASKKSLSEKVAVSETAAGAILTVDLGAIRENYRRLKARLGG
ncbi:alanine racemase, partial [Mesorhizobium sp. M6A.T.Cr.TU.017.01.1.1]